MSDFLNWVLILLGFVLILAGDPGIGAIFCLVGAGVAASRWIGYYIAEQVKKSKQ